MDAIRSIFCFSQANLAKKYGLDNSTPAAVPATTITSEKPLSNIQPTLRVGKPSELQAMTNCFAAAFAEDHAAEYFINCPDTISWTAKQKWAAYVGFTELTVKLHLSAGLVLVMGEPKSAAMARGFTPADPRNPSGEEAFDAVALLMPPGKKYTSLSEKLSGYASIHKVLSHDGLRRLDDDFTPLLMNTKAAILREGDWKGWYLVWLGTRPGARGRGRAKTVLTWLAEQADSKGETCYLESSAKSNLPLYEKFGFSVVRDIMLNPEGERIPLDVMLRVPRVKLGASPSSSMEK